MSQNFSRVKRICSINIIRSKIKILKDGPTKYHFFAHASKIFKNEPAEDHDFYKPNTMQKEINQQKITILMNQLRYKKQSSSKRFQRKKKNRKITGLTWTTTVTNDSPVPTDYRYAQGGGVYRSRHRTCATHRKPHATQAEAAAAAAQGVRSIARYAFSGSGCAPKSAVNNNRQQEACATPRLLRASVISHTHQRW